MEIAIICLAFICVAINAGAITLYALLFIGTQPANLLQKSSNKKADANAEPEPAANNQKDITAELEKLLAYDVRDAYRDILNRRMGGEE